MIELKNIEGQQLINILEKAFQKENITGVVSCENIKNNAISKIFIKSGSIIYASSTIYGEKFGDIMVKKSIISSKELERALKLQKESPEKLIGAILVEMGVISDRVIPSLLYRQIEIIIYEIIVSESCNIKFEEGDFEDHHEYKNKISDNTNNLTAYSDLNKLLNSVMFLRLLKNNLQEIVRIRNFFCDTNVVLKRSIDTYFSQLSFDQRRILRTVNGKSTLHDIIILSDLDYFRTYKILFDLLAEKVIQINGTHTLEQVKLILTQEEIMENIETNDSELISNYKQVIQNSYNEILALKNKLTTYENTIGIFTEDIIEKIANLSVEKKVTFAQIVKNVLEMS